MKITPLPSHPPRGFANWTRLYEDVIKILRPGEETFILHEMPDPALKRQKLLVTIHPTLHYLADLKEKVFKELWQHRLSVEDVNTLTTVGRRFHENRFATSSDDSTTWPTDKAVKDFYSLLERLNIQWREDQLKEK
ncbi:hypothetical protein ACFQ4C_18135 [Larkinella insperata]|uniref:Uncharacterized protein n=1 Tax=Larkinella insperata TaxID=332158 RepID=A0ABW3QA34_9BACT|nr:hypothetical protein [Larkinella insperata]